MFKDTEDGGGELITSEMRDRAFGQSYMEHTAPFISVLTAMYFKVTCEKHHGIQTEVQHYARIHVFTDKLKHLL